MDKVYGVMHLEGLCNNVICACEAYSDAVELAIDLAFDAQYEAFLFCLQQEDPYWYYGGDKYRNTKTEIEVALDFGRYTEKDNYWVDEIPFIWRK